MENRRLTRQLHIMHLSDLHFGKEDHRFDMPPTVTGDRPTREGYPSLLEKLSEDLQDGTEKKNVIICITGDFAQTADYGELQRAEKFIRQLAEHKIWGPARGLKSIYLVPGNHDVDYNKAEMAERWHRYIGFANRLYGTTVCDSDPWGLVVVDDRIDDLGAVIVCFNSAIYVERGTPNEKRGEVDLRQLENVEKSLAELNRTRNLEESIRVALIHHHPVLIPALAEPGRGYDAVQNSGPLLTILRRYGFHLILHGHKHNPFIFTEDSRSAWTTFTQPIVVVAGGSVSSMSIPAEYRERSNCYNRVTIKWHPAARQTRVFVETRGLSVFDSSGKEDLPHNWKWKTLKEEDKLFYAAQCVPNLKAVGYRSFDAVAGKTNEERRISEYRRTRGNMPVVEVVPSLIKGQAYAATAWIVPHPNPDFPRELPCQVTWSAGRMHPMVTIRAEEDARFCAVFDYWDSMLLQAELKFKDSTKELVYAYARMPEDCSKA